MSDTNELDMLRDSVTTFVAKERNFGSYRAQRNQLPGADVKQLKKIAELGWFGILVPEEYDGLGLSLGEMAQVVRHLGAGLMAEPITATAVLGAGVLTRSTNEGLKRELLPQIAMGDYQIALAFQPDQGGIGFSQTGVRYGDGHLTGDCRFVAGAGIADSFLVVAQGAEGLNVYRVARSTPGLGVNFEWRHDGSCVGHLRLENVTGELVCGANTAQEALDAAFDQALIVASAEMLGIMEAVLEMTLEYMRTRVQFDKPIGSYQALQHKVVDLYVLKEICSGVLQEALTSTPPTAAARATLASRTKSRCSDAVMRITRECIQLHGAIGFTYEYDLGLYVHRAMVLAAWLGNGTVHRKRIRELTNEITV
ncbi:acyl-CoA dehydrogenase family protein [Thalassovita sp.]|uniref:acyl-CoA dehydrogenase family protein n=1 Tax=Thalassovita sp. TaxID=1979401 RepID=UPI0029DE53F4|nr:acyl-CoA dehydrogenase family protein [Thalassovita sp.]